MTLKSSFAVVLRALRSKRNITQREFADTTSRTYLSKLEGGKSSITLDKLEQLSERLGLSPLALLALTVSEETGEPAATILAKLDAELRELTRGEGVTGVQPLIPSPEVTPSPSAKQHSSSRPAVGQTELPF